MTPKLDQIAIEFVKRIPDQFQSVVVPGTDALPDAYNMSAVSIIDYVNRALGQLFNNFWQSSGGDIKTFTRIFPELIKLSGTVVLSSGEYIIASPYKDFYKIIGAVKSADNNKYIKPKDDDLYTIYLSQEYEAYKPTEDDPAIIQVGQTLAVFPQTIVSNQIKFHYIRRPVDPTTGNALTQNGDYDSPFYPEWNNAIVDLAYLMYLKETNQTT